MTNEDEKRIADYMGWYWSKDDGIYFYDWDGQRPRYLNLNDAGLVVKEMVKRGGDYWHFWLVVEDLFRMDEEEAYVNCNETEASAISRWLFNADNFFKAFVEWRKGND